MGEVAGADHGDALTQRTGGQMRDVAVFTARTGKLRVDVEIGVEHCRFSSLLLPGRPGDGGRVRSCHGRPTDQARTLARAGPRWRPPPGAFYSTPVDLGRSGQETGGGVD